MSKKAVEITHICDLSDLDDDIFGFEDTIRLGAETISVSKKAVEITHICDLSDLDDDIFGFEDTIRLGAETISVSKENS